VSANTHPPLAAFAEPLARRLDRLAGGADPDEGEAGPGDTDVACGEVDNLRDAGELERLVSGVVAQLRDESTWKGPPLDLSARVLARALG
jgi:hypothetical protein